MFHNVPSFSIIFHHVPSCSIIFHNFPSCSIIFHHVHHFPSCSIIFHHCPSCSIMFQHFPSFSTIPPWKVVGFHGSIPRWRPRATSWSYSDVTKSFDKSLRSSDSSARWQRMRHFRWRICMDSQWLSPCWHRTIPLVWKVMVLPRENGICCRFHGISVGTVVVC